MFNKSDMRLNIAIIWLLCFIALWFIFNSLIPKHEFEVELNQIEKSVTKKDWKQAKKSMQELNNIYNRKRVFIQMNNATEIFTNFDLTIGQLDTSIQHEQEAAIEFIGGLRATLDFVMKTFSGP